MRLTIKNFGPIKESDILVRPMTAFVGANGSGKSYAAYLLWCLLAVEPNWKKLVNLLLDSLVTKSTQNKNKSMSKRVKKLFLITFRESDLFYEGLRDLLMNTFFVEDVKDLIRIGTSKSTFIISDDEGAAKIEFEINHKRGLVFKGLNKEAMKKLSDNLQVDAKWSFSEKEISGKETIHISLKYNDATKEFNPRPSSIKNETFFVGLMNLIPFVFDGVFDGYYSYGSVFIAPDGRAGLTRVCEAVDYALMSGKEKIYINPVDREFRRSLASFTPIVKDKEIAKFSNIIEKELDTKFFIRRAGSRYAVKIGQMEMPLERAPSGHREVGGILYALKYGIERDEWKMIIEEPEAHLHPDAQSAITRTLAGVSGKSVPVLITTHSIHVLDELSNLLRLKKLTSKEKKAAKYEEWEGIDPDDIGVYLFLRDGSTKLLGVSEEGLDESNLDEVIQEIANRHAYVERKFDETANP